MRQGREGSRYRHISDGISAVGDWPPGLLRASGRWSTTRVRVVPPKGRGSRAEDPPTPVRHWLTAPGEVLAPGPSGPPPVCTERTRGAPGGFRRGTHSFCYVCCTEDLSVWTAGLGVAKKKKKLLKVCKFKLVLIQTDTQDIQSTLNAQDVCLSSANANTQTH